MPILTLAAIVAAAVAGTFAGMILERFADPAARARRIRRRHRARAARRERAVARAANRARAGLAR